MNLTETGKLLTFIAELDYRRFTEETVVAWHEVLGRYDYEDCREAARAHNESSSEFLKPGHLGKIIKANRARRLNGITDVLVASVDDMRGLESTVEQYREYQDITREIRESIASGKLSRQDYQIYKRGETPWSEFKKSLGPRGPMHAISA